MGEVVTLNVGGQLFTTHRETLQGSYFEGMFSGKMKPGQTVNGGIFIDRSGFLFEYVLQYLRNVNDWEPPSDLSLLKNLRAEAHYYTISGLIELVETTITKTEETIVRTEETITKTRGTTAWMEAEMRKKKPMPKIETFSITFAGCQITNWSGVPQHVQDKLSKSSYHSASSIISACRPLYRCISIDQKPYVESIYVYFETDVSMLKYTQ